MQATHLLHQLISASATRAPASPALALGGRTMSYEELGSAVQSFSFGLLSLGLGRAERVAVYLDKRPETVIAFFGTCAAGGVFVPVNPVLKREQVGYILRDCNVRVLITSPERYAALGDELLQCRDLRHVVLVGDSPVLPVGDRLALDYWSELLGAPPARGHRTIDVDMAAIFYTSGSTGKPKGVVLSHRNMVTGAKSVAEYLENRSDDTLLAALPLSFDAGFSQLTTAFHVGAKVVLLNYLMPRDVLSAVTAERVTGLTAVPPLWIQLGRLRWPESVTEHLRYIANTGGHMPADTLGKLRGMLPRTKTYLMYGLTEAFRATYLHPDLVDERPGSIGKAIPNAEVLVLRPDGTPCGPNEPGELVQRGALVSLGYWNDPERTAERFKRLEPRSLGLDEGPVMHEVAVFSGDIVRRDEEGYLYFIGRQDEMIKTSGYRVSPTEVEDVLYATKLVGECIAFGVPHEELGQTICAIVTPPPPNGTVDREALVAECRARMPSYMVPSRIEVRELPLPRNPNGKIDRNRLVADWRERSSGARPAA